MAGYWGLICIQRLNEASLMERALLVTIKLESEKDGWELEDSALELEELTQTSGAKVVDNIACVRDTPTPNLFIGSGKTEELAQISEEKNIDTLIFSHDLSGTQQRNLEEIIGRKTIDRTQLILDIFAKHARSPEGKMQVELAQLEYLMPRLVGRGIMLSRLGGGIGTRGPGEKKLEVDRRRIRQRIEKLKTDIKKIESSRRIMRKKRKENLIPTVALVGYTNAGKSTLLNALTNAGQIVSDSLFTTLDPLSKRLVLPNGAHIIVSDTVGFLHNLPHHLIEAFKATLEEVKEADLLIHILDITHPRLYEHREAVYNVLKELEADSKPIITALNKIDLLADTARLKRLKSDFVNSVAISAKLKQNLEILLEEVQKYFASKMINFEITLPHSRMDLLDLFYQEGKIEKIKYFQKGIKVKGNLPKVLYQKLLYKGDMR
jgi:GTP-binding protein HflX